MQKAWVEKLKKLRSSSSSTSAPSSSALTPASRKPKNNYPIIIISSSPTALVTMHNVKKFLQEYVFEPSADARARQAAEGNPKADDVIALYRKKTVIDSSGKEIEMSSRYFVVDSVEALSKVRPIECF